MLHSREPVVADYMTSPIQTIGRDQHLKIAHRMMRDLGMRHLPVVERGQVIGILSLGDLRLIETLRDVDPAQVTVDEAMTPEPYVVDGSASLRDVVAHMAQSRISSAVVVRDRRAIGVLTTIDAMRALVDALDERKARPPVD